ncbi:hypothetical protein FXN63_06510 [Pigmentiphaga aceris]|uniref:Uncharacterized protein n=1 Tax=Pigmentiphaga aceris TaxID=1940612 RepID=A0A5C0AXG9_9BURK|nr:hypothetical protein [Pigmentiphaga aceris]QEI05530.1 hypothetical protein FXN63_06510 [Pigmentiphaga aceris]
MSINTKPERWDFLSGVPLDLFKRANGKCSLPRCNNSTAAPAEVDSSAINMGKAAHIYSASEDGPRGRGGKNEAFIRSAENGLWCCAVHGDLIDKKGGKEFAAEKLFNWKKLVEARARKQVDQVPSPRGWVDVIELTLLPFAVSAKLQIKLSRFNLLHGPSNSGKSVLLELAASITNSHNARRMLSQSQGPRAASNLPTWSGKVLYTTVDVLDKVVQLDIDAGHFRRREGSTPCLLPPGDIEVILCSSNDAEQRTDEDDVEFLMRLLNIDHSTVHALLSLAVGKLLPGKYRIAQGYEDNEHGTDVQLRFKINGKPHFELQFSDGNSWLPLSSLSKSSTDKVILDLFIAKAREVAKQRLTLFLVDGISFNFDEPNYQNLLNTIAAEEFQAVLCLPPRQEQFLLEKREGLLRLKDVAHLRSWDLIQLTR